jgi:4-amino-4-deoxy-L-arabinose transferase-like glycosyltransferase
VPHPSAAEPSPGRRDRSRTAAWIAALALLALHAGLAVSSMAVKSVTNDELSHLPAGLAAVATGELRLNPQHPPLVKWLAGLAASTADPELPLDGAAYRNANQWMFGRQALFESGADHRVLLFRGRLPVVGLSLLGGLGVFLWSRSRFGAAGGLLSLALYAFSPTVLAHGRLVTMDAAVSAGVVWTLYLGWRATSSERVGSPWELPALTGALTGLGLGLALGAKFSALLLVPLLGLLDLVSLGGWRSASSWRRRAVAWSAVAAAAVLVVQALYLFPSDFLRYFHDLGTLYPDYESHRPDTPVYLGGGFRPGGYPHYFLVALAVKTSLPALLAWAGGLAVATGRGIRRDPAWRDDLYLWLPAAVWVAVHSAFAFDLGVRYVLPVYPLLAVLAGGVVPRLRNALGERRHLAALLVGALGLAQLATATAAWPDYLPFFNRPARALADARGGLPWLNHSSLDWGQDLARLAPWLEAKGIERVRLLYYGPSPPEAYGVRREPMLPSDWWQAPRPGDYVVSAQYLVQGLLQAEMPTENGAAPTDWLRRYTPSDVLGGTLYLYRFPAAEPARDYGQGGQGGEAEQPGGGGGEREP